ncbi:uncharacterized protein BDV14DRAFT_201097 [Aspergillus stella-maris]|uniref:uncharacterized protein n=1 Tax=Aspergillus stella-maris TaxID=1810926 RepID=UPI003CCCA098
MSRYISTITPPEYSSSLPAYERVPIVMLSPAHETFETPYDELLRISRMSISTRTQSTWERDSTMGGSREQSLLDEAEQTQKGFGFDGVEVQVEEDEEPGFVSRFSAVSGGTWSTRAHDPEPEYEGDLEREEAISIGLSLSHPRPGYNARQRESYQGENEELYQEPSLPRISTSTRDPWDTHSVHEEETHSYHDDLPSRSPSPSHEPYTTHSANVYRDTSHVLISEVSSILAAKGIGCLLWGEHLLRTYGSSIHAHDYKFLLEDAAVLPGFFALLDAGFEECPGSFDDLNPNLNPSTTSNTDSDNERESPAYICPLIHKHNLLTQAGASIHKSKYHGFPAKHVHFRIDDSEADSEADSIVIGLYRKSLHLPTQFTSLDPPEIWPGEMGRIANNGRLVYANELGPRPTKSHGGRFPSDLGSEVLMLSPMYLIETLILLGNRDSRTPGSRSLWTKWLMHLRETYLLHNYNLSLWDDRSLLPEILRPVWESASDAELNRVDEPIMNVWRDLAWTLAGVDVDAAKRMGHMGFDCTFQRVSGEWVEERRADFEWRVRVGRGGRVVG